MSEAKYFMLKSKTIEILKSFSLREWNDCRNYLSSAYLNENKNLLHLFDLLKNFYPEFAHEQLTKPHLHLKLFPHQKYHDQKMRYLLSDLTIKLEDYLAYSAFYLDQQLQHHLKLKELAKRDCVKSYSNKLKSGEGVKYLNVDHYRNNFDREFIHLNHWTSKQRRKEDNGIDKVSYNLDCFYISHKLQFACEAINAKGLLLANENKSDATLLFSHLKANKYDDAPFIQIYHCILKILINIQPKKQFELLCSRLIQNENNFSAEDLREMYQYAMNFCIRWINKGENEYLRVLFDIYKIILNNRVIFNEGFLSQWDYKNIVTLSLRLEETNWTLRFINDYAVYLRPKEKENAFIYNLAYYHFFKKQYAKTLGLFQKVVFTDVVYQLDVRSILLKIYFEVGEEETFFYHAAAFKAFLHRNKQIAVAQQQLYKNLIQFTQKLIRAGTNSTKLTLIIKEIDKNPNVADLKWLKEKVEELQ